MATPKTKSSRIFTREDNDVFYTLLNEIAEQSPKMLYPILLKIVDHIEVTESGAVVTFRAEFQNIGN